MTVVSTHRRILHSATLTLLFTSLSVATLAAQLGAGVRSPDTTVVSSTSAAARIELLAGIDDLNNAFATRGAEHLRRALALDENLGVARVLYASVAPGLTAEQRKAEMNRGVTSAAAVSTGELVTAQFYRAWFTGDNKQAIILSRAAMELLPNDPNIAWSNALITLNGNLGNGTRALREAIRLFPDYAPSYNNLAYALWSASDRAGALQAAQQYISRAPNHPNPYDTYAELLQWSGRFEEAIVQLQKAIAVDPDFLVAYPHMAAIQTLQGRNDLARASITTGMQRVKTDADRARFQRMIAASWAMDGNLKNTTTALGAVAPFARSDSNSQVEGTSHVLLAVYDAILGDGRNAAGHLTAAGTIGDTTDSGRRTWVAFAHAFNRQNDLARSGSLALRDTLMEGSNVAVANAHLINALVYLNEGNGAAAMSEATLANPSAPLTRAIMALAQQRLGNTATARSLRDEVMNDRDFDLTNTQQVVARVLVKRIV